VSRLPSGPNIVKGSTSLPPEQDASISEEQMMDIIQRLVDGSEDVGERFVEEARRIHYDEAPARQIKGIATLAETRDLIEEGIAVVPLGVPRKGETH
jgi:hypothetical protein